MGAAFTSKAGAEASGGVLVVGDSLEVGSGPYVEGDLSPTPVTVDAVVGRTSGEILEALRANIASDPAVVVFDAGTNDDPANPAVLAANLEAASELAAGRCMVVATINRPPYNGYGPEGLNQVIASFAAARPGTVVVDWQAAALAHPELINSDGVHPTPEGYALRGQMIAQGVQRCLAGEFSAPSTPTASPPAKPQPPQQTPAESRAEAAYLVVSEAIGRLRERLAASGPAAWTPLAALYVLGLP